MEYELGNAPRIDTKALLDDTAKDLRTVAVTHAKPAGFELMLEDDFGRPIVDQEPPLDVDDWDASAEREALVLRAEHERLSRLYPNSIHTSDLKHVVDNLLGECLDEMSKFLRLHWVLGRFGFGSSSLF